MESISQLICPICESDNVLVTEEVSLFINTLEHYCHSVKFFDSNAKVNCLDCDWDGQRSDLKLKV